MGPKPEPGAEDPYMIDAGKNKTTLVPGGCFVHHADAFLMIRGGHLDVSLLGAFEVSESGDLANWTTEDPAFPPGVGGAMDLAVGAKAIRVIMDHTGKSGEPRILKRCPYPLTAAGCVKRIYTNLAVHRCDAARRSSVVEMIAGHDAGEAAGADRAEACSWPRIGRCLRRPRSPRRGRPSLHVRHARACPGHPRLDRSATERRGWPGRGEPKRRRPSDGYAGPCRRSGTLRKFTALIHSALFFGDRPGKLALSRRCWFSEGRLGGGRVWVWRNRYRWKLPTLRFRGKVMLGFAVVLAISAVSMGIAYLGFERVSAGVASYRNSVSEADLARNIDRELISYRALARYYVVTGKGRRCQGGAGRRGAASRTPSISR